MASSDRREVDRRSVLLGGVAAGTVIVLSTCGGDDAGDEPGTNDSAGADDATNTTVTDRTAAPPNAPDEPDEVYDEETPEQTEGPFFSPDTPEKADFRGDVGSGMPLLVSGQVVSLEGEPLAGTLLDIWQADHDGNYDNEGFRLRGHQFTDGDGRWRLDTIVPGLYPGRTRHIHVKVQPRGQPELTTQLYFPDEPANDQDTIFDAELLMEMPAGFDPAQAGQEATYTFVMDT